MENQNITFVKPQETGFSKEMRMRVNKYFKENKISVKGNYMLWIKFVFWMMVYVSPFVLILTGVLTGFWAMVMVVVMGAAMAGIGLNIMHDANHGSFSKKKWVNDLAGSTLILLGGNPYNWKLQHNILHHSFTNIFNKDEDVSPPAVMKFDPSDKTRWIHRFQHIYAVLFYGLMTLSWTISKDYIQIVQFYKKGMLKGNKSSLFKEILRITAVKVFYYAYILVLPIFVMDFIWWQWLIAFFVMHFTAGVILALIFQCAHVVEETSNPVPDAKGHIEDEWMVHQLKTTANFGTKSKILNWFSGGLNFQIEHHLFPNISHVHYPKLSKIVRKTAKDFGLKYHNHVTFLGAIISHFRTLSVLGKG